MLIFRGTQEELKRDFSLNALTVMWVGILRGKQIFLTEPVLELCKPNAPLEMLMRDRSLLGALDNFRNFEEFQAKYDPERNFPLTLLDKGNEKVIALSDEILAEQGWENQKESENSQETSLTQLEGLETLFSGEEIARLKMTIATAVSASERIEAIRKMALSGLETKEKVLLFLHALGDSDLKVRSEAAKALEQAGLNSEITEAIHYFNIGDEKQREHAIGGMGKLFRDATEVEKGAILQTFLTALYDREYRREVIQLIDTFNKIIPNLPANPTMINRIMGCMVENLVSFFDKLHEKVRQLFIQLAKLNEKQVCDFLYNEMQKSEIRRLRALLLSILAEFSLSVEKQHDVIQVIVEEIGYGDELDPIYLRLIGTLENMGGDSIEPLLGRFKVSKRAGEKVQLVQLTNVLLSKSKVDRNLKEDILKAYIESYPTSHNVLRMAFFESHLLGDSKVSARLKTNFVKEVLGNSLEDSFDKFPEVAKNCFCKIKKPAIKALLDVLKKPINLQQSTYAADFLGDVILELSPKEKKELNKIKEFCIKQIEEKPLNEIELYKVLGKLAATPNIETKQAEEICEFLLENICHAASSYSVIEALSWAGAGDKIPVERKFDLCHLFITLLDKRLPSNISDHKDEGEKGSIYEFNFKATAYTELLPNLIMGLQRLSIVENTPKALRDKIVAKFLEKWQDIISYKIIWGPKNAVDLATAMQKLCMAATTSDSTKIKLAQALFQRVEIFYVTELLVVVFEKAENPSSDMLKFASEVVQKLIEFSNHKDYQNAEDREIILRCIGCMVQAKHLSSKKKDSENNRERLLYVLFEGLRDKVFGIDSSLRNLLDSPNIPQNLKKEIKKRLPKRFSLASID